MNKKCRNCVKEFWAYKSKIGKQYFCNNRCRYEFMRGKNAPKPFSQVKHICEICGKELNVSLVDMSGIRLFGTKTILLYFIIANTVLQENLFNVVNR